MGGHDTAKGMTFQHAYAVYKSVLAIADSEVAALRFEGSTDSVDIEALRESDAIAWAVQAKTRQEGDTWPKAELLRLLNAWFDDHPGTTASFEFASDGQLGKSSLKLRRMIEAAARGIEPSGTDTAETGLTRDQLATLTLNTRLPDAGVLIQQAEHHLQKILEPIETLAPTLASSRISELFKEISIASGGITPSDRTRTIREIATILGVPDVIRVGLSGRPQAIRGLSSQIPLFSQLVDRSDLVRLVVDKLSPAGAFGGRIALFGPPGFGKTALAGQVAEACYGAGSRVLWVEGDPGDSPAEVLRSVADAIPLSGLTGSPSLPELASRLKAGLTGCDLVVVDDLWSPEAADVLKAAVPVETSLLATTGTREVADRLGPFHVGGLSTTQTLESLAQDLAATDALRHLAELIGGWPLLLDLVRRSLRRAVRIGVDPNECVDSHLQMLLHTGPTAFDRAGDEARRSAIRGALTFALAGLSSDEADDARRLGILDGSHSIEIEVLNALWRRGTFETRSLVALLDEVGILRADISSGTFSLHRTVAAGLAALSNDEEISRFHSQFVAGMGTPFPASLAYVARHRPFHTLSGGDHDAALLLVADPAWASQLAVILGDERFIARQAHDLARLASRLTTVTSTTQVWAWLLAGVHSIRFTLDPAIVRLFALARGLELAEALVEASDSPQQAALGHAELAALLADRDLEAAEVHARSARERASEQSELVIPDLLVVTIRRLAAARPEWAKACRETIEGVVQRQSSDERGYTRAVIANELFAAVPDFAASLLSEVAADIRASLESGRPIEGMLGENPISELSNLLPVLGFLDFDLASLVLETAIAEGIANESELLAYGGPALGLVVRDPRAALQIGELAERVQGESQVLMAALSGCVERGDGDAAEHLLALVPPGTTQVRVLAHTASEICRVNGSAAAGQWFDRATLAVQSLRGETEFALGCVYLAESLVAYNPTWAAKITREVLGSPRVAGLVEDRVELGLRLQTVLSATDQKYSMDGEAVDLLVKKLGSRGQPRARLSPLESFRELSDAVLAAAVTHGLDPAAVADSPPRWAHFGTSFWAACYESLQNGSSAVEAVSDSLLDHAGFGGLESYASGRAGWFAFQLWEVCGAAKGLAAVERFPERLRDLVAGECACWMQAAGARTAEVQRALRLVESRSHSARVTAQLDSLVHLKAGDAVGALWDLRRSVEVVLAADDADVVSGARSVPLAILSRLGGVRYPDLADVPELFEGTAGYDLAVSILPCVAGLRPAEVLSRFVPRPEGSAFASELSAAGARSSLLTELCRRAPADTAAALQAELLAEPTSLAPDDIARSVDFILRADDVDDSVKRELAHVLLRRLQDGYDFSLDSASAARVGATMSVVATGSVDMDILEAVVPAWLVGPAVSLAAVAGGMLSPAERYDLFVDGVRLSRGAGPEDFVTVCRLLGDALSAIGWAGTGEIGHRFAFEMWPGGFSGMLLSMGRLASPLVRRIGPVAALEMIGTIGRWFDQ